MVVFHSKHLNTAHITGTNHYTPPEYFSTGQYDGCQGTVWQLGILLMELLSPVMAFDKPEQALSVKPQIPDHLSAGTHARNAWAKNNVISYR